MADRSLASLVAAGFFRHSVLGLHQWEGDDVANAAAVGKQHDQPVDAQPHARRVARPRAVQPDEGLQHLAQVFLGNAGAVILDRQRDAGLLDLVRLHDEDLAGGEVLLGVEVDERAGVTEGADVLRSVVEDKLGLGPIHGFNRAAEVIFQRADEGGVAIAVLVTRCRVHVAHVIKITVIDVRVAVRVLISNHLHVVSLIVVVTRLQHVQQTGVALIMQDGSGHVIEIRVRDEVMQLLFGIEADRLHNAARDSAAARAAARRVYDRHGSRRRSLSDPGR